MTQVDGTRALTRAWSTATNGGRWQVAQLECCQNHRSRAPKTTGNLTKGQTFRSEQDGPGDIPCRSVVVHRGVFGPSDELQIAQPVVQTVTVLVMYHFFGSQPPTDSSFDEKAVGGSSLLPPGTTLFWGDGDAEVARALAPDKATATAAPHTAGFTNDGRITAEPSGRSPRVDKAVGPRATTPSRCWQWMTSEIRPFPSRSITDPLQLRPAREEQVTLVVPPGKTSTAEPGTEHLRFDVQAIVSCLFDVAEAGRCCVLEPLMDSVDRDAASFGYLLDGQEHLVEHISPEGRCQGGIYAS